MEVEELQKRNRHAFRIPEWFVYTSRAFLTLEGVNPLADANFSIIKSCFPYVAKRLLADDNSPQARDVLRNLLYGAEQCMEPKRFADFAYGLIHNLHHHYQNLLKSKWEVNHCPAAFRYRNATRRL